MTTDHDLTYRQQVIDRLAALLDRQAEQADLLRDMANSLLTLRHDNEHLLRAKGDPCPCGCRRDVEPKPGISLPPGQEPVMLTHPPTSCDAVVCDECDPKPEPASESVTVTLPRDVVEAYTPTLWRDAAADLRHAIERKAANLCDAVADALDAASATQEADQGERVAQACDWSDFRRDYGASPDPEIFHKEHRAFLAGWQAGRHGDQSGVLR